MIRYLTLVRLQRFWPTPSRPACLFNGHQYIGPRTRDISTIHTSHKQGNSKNNYGHSNDYDDKQYGSRFRFNRGLGSMALAATGLITLSQGSPPPGGDALFEDLHQAVLEGDERKVEMLVKRCKPEDINRRHELGWQMLHVAAVHGRHRICELLIKYGANVNDRDKYSTPLAVGKQLNMDPLLVSLTREDQFCSDLGPRISYLDFTPLHYAVISNSLDTIKLLAKYGANPTLKSDKGYLPVQFTDNQTISRFMAQYEKDYLVREKELEEEEKRRYPLEKRVKEHIIGQDAAISMVAATIRRKETGWFDPDHPLVFLFLGSSGVGKTELAKRIAKYMHKENRDAFVRLDMSEYQEKHSVARMIGSPPGYVGHQDGGRLTEALKKCKNAVVLFDEVEKAHPDVLTVLLQLFDEGRLTDGKGETIECKDAIFIMTSNLASEAIAEHALQLRDEQRLIKEARIKGRLAVSKDEDYQEQITISRKFKDAVVKPILKFYFQRDEFLGRINEMVYFLPFSDKELRQLVLKELAFWSEKAKRNNGIDLSWDDDVVDAICKEYDVNYGARSLKHRIESRLINEVSELHYRNRDAKKIHISVKTKGGPDEPDLFYIKTM